MAHVEPRTVLDLVRCSVERDPTAVALLGTKPGERITYAQLLAEMLQLACALRSQGIGPSDPVLVSLPNGPGLLTAALGTMCAAVCAPMNSAYTSAELERLADDTGAVAVVVESGSSGPAAALAQRHGLVLVHLGDGEPTGQSDFTPAPGSPALLLHTAGTTARPKQVPLSHANLAAAARNVVESLALTPRDRCLNVMPLFHSHGLLGAAMSSLSAGASIVCGPGMDPRRFLDWAAAFDCTWYTAAPTIHRLVLEAPGDWQGFRFIRSASAPLPPQVARGLEERYGVPVIEVYGMTEAYQIAANPLPPGERRPGSVGSATGTEVAVLGADGVAHAFGGDGEILVRGPAVFHGYSFPAEANEEAFLGGWFRTGDVGRISEDGYLTITGRVKEQINRGGEKIAPREVEEVLLDHPHVAEVIAFAIPDAHLGEEIGVAIVAKPGTDIDIVEIRAFMSSRVAAYKVPRRVLVVAEIPKSDTGKPQRIAFARDHSSELAQGPAEVPGRIGADASTSQRLAALWQEILGLDKPPPPAARFFDLGGTSLAVMELVIRIEDTFCIDLPVIDVLAVPTLGELSSHLDSLASHSVSAPLLRRYREGESGQHIVLIPGQMGMAVGLNLIADAIDADVSVYLFDYPGHRPGEQPLRSIEELAMSLVIEMRRSGITENVALYGNSVGAWVALESAVLLAADGSMPLFVGIGDMYSPFFNTKRSPLRPSIPRRFRNRLRRAAGRFRRRPTWSDSGGRTPTARRRQLAVSDASTIARRAYRPRLYEGDLIVVAAAERAPVYGETLGYDRHTTGRITTVPVAGGHSAMHREQAAPIGAALAAGLRACPGQ